MRETEKASRRQRNTGAFVEGLEAATAFYKKNSPDAVRLAHVIREQFNVTTIPDTVAPDHDGYLELARATLETMKAAGIKEEDYDLFITTAAKLARDTLLAELEEK